MQPQSKRGEMTGLKVLIWLVAFFGIVFAVNGVMVNAAISTFGGVETSSSYQAGLKFESEVARAEQQDALHWKVNGHLARDAAGAAVLDITVADAQGQPVGGLTADAKLAHPADERLDHVITLSRSGAGQFHGQHQAQRGQWDLIIDLYRGDTRVFHSLSRVTLQ